MRAPSYGGLYPKRPCLPARDGNVWRPAHVLLKIVRTCVCILQIEVGCDIVSVIRDILNTETYGVAMDFSIFPDSGRYYAGSERKKGVVLPDGTCYMVKFQKATPFGKRFNHVSEYLGSHVFKLAGLDAQETHLGTYAGAPVVACKDFIGENSQFVPFNDVGESTLEQDKETYQYDYDDIMRMLRDNAKLTNVRETVDVFWRMYVVDALLGNFDRHGANWGFIKRDGRYSMAPVFDNGSCLFPNLVDDESLLAVLGSRDEMLKRAYEFPTSQVRLAGRKSSYHQVISSSAYAECNRALGYVLERLDLARVNRLVDTLDGASDVRRRFYREMIGLRYRLMLEEPYVRVRGGVR